MSRAEAEFICDAACLADTGAFANVSDLAVVLRRAWPKQASDYLQDDVWHCLDNRCQAARQRASRC